MEPHKPAGGEETRGEPPRGGARRFRFLLVFAALALAAAPVLAQPAPPPPLAAQGQAAPVSDFVSDGFRSAKYGMSETEVRAAIAADFGIKGDAVAATTNTAERTQLLTISVPGLLPDGGTAQVSYVFGYASKGLIQVGVSWSAATDPSIDAAKLHANGDVLVAYFAAAGYVPETIRTGVVLESGILLFRGEDKDGHATILLLNGDYSDGGDAQKILKPTSLALLYAANSANPDIFKIDRGQF